ncbi:hypothetical protein JCM3770_006188 [Rhodotorula araucariae]
MSAHRDRQAVRLPERPVYAFSGAQRTGPPALTSPPATYSLRGRSPSSSIVPNSQSPEPGTIRTDTQPVARDYASAPTARRARFLPTDLSFVADSQAGSGEAPLRPRVKSEEEDSTRVGADGSVRVETESTFSTASSSSVSSVPSRSTRARSPSAPEVRQRCVKDESDVKQEELTDELRRQLWGSRVNEMRKRPDRRRDRAPSHEVPVKREAGPRGAHALGLGGRGDRGTSEYNGAEEEGQMLPPSRTRPLAIALGKRPARDDSSSSSASSSSNEGEGETDRVEDETDELETVSEGTPFEERPPKREKVVEQLKKPASSTKNPKQKEKQRQLDIEAASFLESLDLPAPIYRPVAIKARLINRLADTTATLPAQARIDRVETPVRRPSPSPSPVAAATPALRSPTPPTRRIRPGSGPSHTRPTSAAESLPDYDDEDVDDPEQPAAAFVDAKLLEEQAYFRCPTKAGAMERWVVMLHKDKRRLPPVYDYDVLIEDRAFLRSARLPVPPACESFSLARDFQNARFKPLVQSAPSHETCAALWDDLLAPSHLTAHQRADPATATGRSCRCPVWVPPGRRDWAVERAWLEREGCGVDDLVEAADAAFNLGAQRVACEVRERPARADDLVKIVFAHNWLWYNQLVELARIARCSRLLASPATVHALREHIARSQDRYGLQHRLAAAERCDDEQRARREGRLARVELLQEVKLMETQWAREEAALQAFLARLEAFLVPPLRTRGQHSRSEGSQGRTESERLGAGGSMPDWLPREGLQ